MVGQATFLIWGSTREEVEERAQVVRESVPGDWHEGRMYEGVRPNPEVTAAVAEAFGAFGRPFVTDPPPLPFATDFGNISQRVPAALIGVGREGGWSFHTDEGAEQFASEDGEEAGLAVARVIALTAARLTG